MSTEIKEKPRLYLVTTHEGRASVMPGPETRQRVMHALAASSELTYADDADGGFTIRRNSVAPVTYEPVTELRADLRPTAARYEEHVSRDGVAWTKLGVINKAHVTRSIGNALRRGCLKVTLTNDTIVLLREHRQTLRFIPTKEIPQ